MSQKKFLLGLGALSSLAITLFALQKLILNDFPSKSNIAMIYFLYASALLATLHTAIFWLRLELLETRGCGLPKNTPRYIDYCITIIIAVGLFQINFSEDSMAKYITTISGTKQDILTNIQNAAQKHLDTDCKPDSGLLVEVCESMGRENCKQKKRFTTEFCMKTAEILNQKNMENYILEVTSKDTEYLNHPIEFIATNGGPQAVYSPLKRFVNQLSSSVEYSKTSINSESKLALNWIIIILLPLIIALRALKTSVEIFGKL